MKKLKKFHKRKILICIILLLFNIVIIGVLLKNPIIIYKCDKDAAMSIISKENILMYGKSIYQSSILKPVVIYISEFTINDKSSISLGKIEILYIPMIGRIGAKIMNYSMYDAPEIRTYYKH